MVKLNSSFALMVNTRLGRSWHVNIKDTTRIGFSMGQSLLFRNSVRTCGAIVVPNDGRAVVVVAGKYFNS